MAELLLQVGVHPTYEDGDIIHCFTDRGILHVHSQIACSPRFHPDRAPRIGNATRGLLVRGSIFEDLSALKYKYRFERISKREVRRIDLVTLNEEIFSDVPRLVDGRNQHIHVEEWVTRHLNNDHHKIFGVESSAVWYGLTKIPSLVDLEDLWTRIEAETGELRSAHTKFPLTSRERARHLPIAYDEDVTEQQAADLGKPIYDNETDPDHPILIKKRQYGMDYAAIYPAKVTDINNEKKIVDLRDETQRTLTDVIDKATLP